MAKLSKYDTLVLSGVLAQLARALHSHCRGRRFDSAILHQKYIKTDALGRPFLIWLECGQFFLKELLRIGKIKCEGAQKLKGGLVAFYRVVIEE